MAKPNEDVLEFSVAIDIRDSLKEIARTQVAMAKLMSDISKTSDRTSKQQTKRNVKTKKETEALTDAVEGLTGAYKEEGKQVDGLARTIELLEKRVSSLTGVEQEAAAARLADLKKEKARRDEIAGQKEKAKKKEKKEKKADEPADLTFSPKNLKKFKSSVKKLRESLKKPLRDFLQRDLAGGIESALEVAGPALKRTLRLPKFLANASADALTKAGERASFKGKSEGGKEGARLQTKGAALKTMGSAMGTLGKGIGLIAKLGPILTGIAGPLTAVIKLFLDADAMVKEFNKGILDSASNIEFLERAGGSANAAMLNMEDSLQGMRDAAMDGSFNNALGITKDTHMAILNTLTQEGVALATLTAEAGNTAEGMKALTQSIVATGVAYSRSLGVPLNEIASLQAEMAVEMGSSVENTSLAFTKMARSAAASGIAGNKFFSIIRAASADLSLWNYRLEGAIDLLGKLGKIMSPRAAQQFFQTVSQGFKSMGRQDLLKQTLMAGVENVRKVLKEDVLQSQADLAKNIQEAGGGKGMSAAEILKEVQKGYGSADALIRGADSSKIGVLRQKAAEIERKSQGASGGTFELSQASGEIQDPAAQVQIFMDAVQSLGGSLLKPNKMALAQTAETLGINQEQVRELHSLALAADTQKKILLDQAKNDPKEQERIAKMSWQQLINSDESLKAQSDKAQENQAAATETVQDAIKQMSKEQGQKTISLTEKFENLMNWFMSTFYNLVFEIWDAITSLPFFKDGDKDRKRAIYKSGNNDLIRAFDAAKKDGKFDEGKFRENLQGVANPKLKDLSTPEARAKVAQSVGSVSAAKAAGGNERLEFRHRKARVLGMATMSGLDPGKTELLKKALNSQKSGNLDLEKIFKDVGLTLEEQTNLLSKAGYVGDADDMMNLVKSLGGSAAGGSKATDAPAPTSPLVTTATETEKTNQHLAEVAQDNKKQEAVLQQTGVKLSPATLKEEAKGMEASMLSALRTALFEYYMYSGTDRGTLLTAMNKGGVTDPRQMAAYFGQKSVEGASTLPALEGIATAQGNAAGGLVTGIANGMAVVAAHGEGLASVGRGERIVPAGGGGGPGVNVSVNGVGGQDLARLIEGKVVEGIREYKRRERLY